VARVPHLILPREKPDGTISWEEEQTAIAARIRDGDAALGWLGDDRLSLHLNVAFAREDPRGLPRWEIWRRDEDGGAAMVTSCVRLRIDGDQLIRQLAAHDSRTHDIAAEVLARNDTRVEASKAAFREANEDRADKLAWALGRDLGIPAQDGRPYG
jgi:hypothetical protein